MEEAFVVRVVAALLLVGAVRTACLQARVPATALLDPATGAPTLVPDLERDGVDRLALLPGVGRARARAIVAARPKWPRGPWNAGMLALVPGVGPATAEEVGAWLRAQGSTASPVECTDEGVCDGGHRSRRDGGARAARGSRARGP